MEIIGSAGATAVSAAAPGLYGGAAMMSGLATIGESSCGGLLTAVVSPAVAGIVTVTAVPAALAGTGLNALVKRFENDKTLELQQRWEYVQVCIPHLQRLRTSIPVKLITHMSK